MVPKTDPCVPGSGDLERSLNRDPEVRVLPGVRRKMIPEYFPPNSLPLISRFRHRFRGITCALESTGVAHSQQVPLQAGQLARKLYPGSLLDRVLTPGSSEIWILCGGLGLSDASLDP